jgi:SAM-dependent methyltransferase
LPHCVGICPQRKPQPADVIAVLRDWRELGDCINTLELEGLPLHATVQKNWDHMMIRRILNPHARDVAIIDLGCGRGHTLKFLRALGFTNLSGIDLSLDWRLVADEARTMLRERRIRPPYHINRASVCDSGLPANSFGVALSVSTVEHGVDIDGFMLEAYRLLGDPGVLIITTDYWHPKIDTSDSVRAFGLPWKIFDRDEVTAMIESARRAGFELLDGDGSIPPCESAPVVWQRRRYTFIGLAFRKGRDTSVPTRDRG